MSFAALHRMCIHNYVSARKLCGILEFFRVLTIDDSSTWDVWQETHRDVAAAVVG